MNDIINRLITLVGVLHDDEDVEGFIESARGVLDRISTDTELILCRRQFE